MIMSFDINNVKEKAYKIENISFRVSRCGTGFFVSSKGYFVTANHNVVKSFEYEGGEDGYLVITKPSNDFNNVNITIEDTYGYSDFALLKIEEDSDFEYIDISLDALELGDEVYALGYPELMQCEETKGSIIGDERLDWRFNGGHKPSSYQIKKVLEHGYSGGPLISSITGAAHAFCAYNPKNIGKTYFINFSDKYVKDILNRFGIVQ